MSKFDWIFYTNFYNDIKNAGIDDKQKAFEHYQSHGISEQRKTWIDIKHYISKCVGGIDNSLYPVINNHFVYQPNQYVIKFVLSHIKQCDHILEVNCGIACASLPIISFLQNNGQYYGWEKNTLCTDWCSKNISPLCKALFTNDPLVLVKNNEINVTIINPSPLDDMIDIINHVLPLLKTNCLLIIIGFIENRSYQRLNQKFNQRFKNTLRENELVSSFNRFHFKISEAIFGNWSGQSKSNIYPDIICLNRT